VKVVEYLKNERCPEGQLPAEARVSGIRKPLVENKEAQYRPHRSLGGNVTAVNEDTALNEEEQNVIEYSLKGTEAERLVTWRALIGSWGSEEEILRRFSPGTHGHHESFDRASMIMNEWVDYVLNHPSTVMSKEATRLACLAEAFMNATYQKLACMGDEGPPTVNIEVEEYNRLKEAEAWNNDLKAAGVDSWDGYDYACRLRRERRVAEGDDNALRHNSNK
jgi:hypothetical protein